MFSINVVDAAEAFWNEANLPNSLPREVEIASIRSCPLTIVKSRGLTFQKALRNAEEYGISLGTSPMDRSLHAVLLANRGHGILFVNADDSPAEQRFSVAHEVAHWIFHYLAPRRAAVCAAGLNITEVLDGLRSPSHDERVYAVIGGATIRPYTHMMARGATGEIVNSDWIRAEDEADMLALEILAPSKSLLERMRQLRHQMDPSAAESTLRTELENDWGLPSALARVYASMCRSWMVPKPSFRAWLGVSE